MLLGALARPPCLRRYRCGRCHWRHLWCAHHRVAPGHRMCLACHTQRPSSRASVGQRVPMQLVVCVPLRRCVAPHRHAAACRGNGRTVGHVVRAALGLRPRYAPRAGRWPRLHPAGKPASYGLPLISGLLLCGRCHCNPLAPTGMFSAARLSVAAPCLYYPGGPVWSIFIKVVSINFSCFLPFS